MWSFLFGKGSSLDRYTFLGPLYINSLTEIARNIDANFGFQELPLSTQREGIFQDPLFIATPVRQCNGSFSLYSLNWSHSILLIPGRDPASRPSSYERDKPHSDPFGQTRSCLHVPLSFNQNPALCLGTHRSRILLLVRHTKSLG